MQPIKTFEMFAGYGGASFALKKANILFECVGYSEIDKFAIKCYEQNHPNIKNYGDCKLIKTEELPDFDLLTGGFPCQDVSISGNRDLSKGRTNLYKEMLRIAKEKKPKFILMENVKGLLSMDCEISEEQQQYHQKLMEKIVFDFKSIGYGVAFKVLNSKDFGIPQNRERVWIVCKYGGWQFMEFMFPEKTKSNISLKDILEINVPPKYYLSNQKSLNTLKKIDKPETNNNNPKQIAIIGKGCQGARIYDPNHIAITINAVGGGKAGRTGFYDVSILDIYNHKEFFDRCPTLTMPNHNTLFAKESIIIDNRYKDKGRKYKTFVPTLNSHGDTKGGVTTPLVKSSNKIRKLTPKECFRLMGFSDNEINLHGLSDNQCYKLAGNGWDINLVSLIFKNLFRGEQCKPNTQES